MRSTEAALALAAPSYFDAPTVVMRSRGQAYGPKGVLKGWVFSYRRGIPVEDLKEEVPKLRSLSPPPPTSTHAQGPFP